MTVKNEKIAFLHLRIIFIIIFILFIIELVGQETNIINSSNEDQSYVTHTYIDSLNKIAFSVFRTNPAETRKMALENLSLSRAINYKTGEGKAYNYLAMSYHIVGNYDTSYVYYKKALSIFELENDTLNTGKIYNNLALLFSHREYYNLALEYNFKSLEIAEKMNDAKSKFHSYNNIGIIYEKLGEYYKAIDSYNSGLQVLNDENIANDLYYYAMSNMGIINLLTNNYDDARNEITKGLEYFLSVDDNYGISQSYGYLAQLAIKLDNYVEAEKLLSKSNVYAAKTADKKLFITNQFFEAIILFKRNQLNNARKKFTGVLASAKEGDYFEMEIESNFYLSKIDSISTNYKSALRFCKAAHVLQDSINSMKIRNQIAELNIQYQTYQKDKEIGLLTTNKEMQDLKIKKQLTQRKLLLAVLLGVLSIVIIVVFSRLKIKKKNQLLSLKNEEIEDKNKELLYHQEKLEYLIDERTSELNKSKVKAEESDRLKSAFLANMSHEIRTPMNGILGFAELLKQPNLTGELQAKYLQIIEKSGARMLNIINDIVSISQIESGDIKVNNSQVNLNEQFEFVYDSLKLIAESKSLKFSFAEFIPKTEISITSDKGKFLGILSNLVKNAVKYTDKGKIEFGYKIDGGHIKAFIKDTGIGIPQEKHEAIFERFIQADIADKDARQGAGIGLSIARAYVEKLGGKIWLESILGVGTTFYFTIPYKAESIENNDTKTIQRISDDLKLKILIVEDDETSEMFLSIELEKYCKEILKASTGFDAINICKQNLDIDLIMMDIQMPNLNGFEATRQIRAFNKDVIIIAQTAFALLGDKEKALHAGCNDYLSKPIDREKLSKLISAYFK